MNVSPFSLNQEATEEVTREEPTVAYVSTVNNLLLIERPIAAEYVGPLQQQPRLMAVDEKVKPSCDLQCTRKCIRIIYEMMMSLYI